VSRERKLCDVLLVNDFFHTQRRGGGSLPKMLFQSSSNAVERQVDAALVLYY